MPCCAISHAATLRQSHVAARLDGLAAMQCGPAPLLLLVGRAMASVRAGDAEVVDVRAVVARTGDGVRL
jgi:uroporphyrin-III C-methyltransferase